jgi:hypothetical protein
MKAQLRTSHIKLESGRADGEVKQGLENVNTSCGLEYLECGKGMNNAVG